MFSDSSARRSEVPIGISNDGVQMTVAHKMISNDGLRVPEAGEMFFDGGV